MERKFGMGRRLLFLSGLFMAAGALFAGCAGISESECLAGNWASLGFRDGARGSALSGMSAYARQCSEYGARIDRSEYLRAYGQGLRYYCTYDNGYALGERGGSFKSVCNAPGLVRQAGDFRTGYDHGRAEYGIRHEYQKLENRIRDRRRHLADVRHRLKHNALDHDERFRLVKKEKRLRRELEACKRDFRFFRRRHGLL